MPEFCPNSECSTRLLSDRPDDEIVMPNFRSAATRANDNLYRQMETASEHRAEMAAEKLGVPVSEMSDLKITNLRETRHEGAIAAMPVVNPVSTFMQQHPGAGGYKGDGANYSGSVMTGPSPNRGARVQSMVRQMHSESMALAGFHGLVGDRPANEITQNPNYRRRV